ncbi:unnamed protein product [Paramecium sonneborni]|uniref:Cyclic nucleotide-binding domain-containing protein n=1 Tax=Paramecium sonneborni TaxID=65129 RepID=A0A8S1NRD4_9CILI|nr:unnamed protein product [Paramecium sonneborni]
MRNDNVISPKTEPIFNNYDLFKGPFQYTPFTVGHPDQPDDDHSVRDPTVKTIEKSRMSLSPIHTYQKMSQDKLSFNPKASRFQQFSNFEPSNLIDLPAQKKPIRLKQKFIDVLRNKIKMNEKISKFLHLIDLDLLDLQKQYVLLPNSVILKIWNIFYYLLLFYYFIIIPLSDKNHQILFLVLKIIDCFLKACSALPNNGEIERNMVVILKNYYKTLFIFDIIFVISLILIIIEYQIQWIIILINIASIQPRLIDLQKNIQYEFNIFNVYQQLVLLIVKQILLIHILTCFWIYNLENEEDFEGNFISIYLKKIQLIVSLITFNSNFTYFDNNNKIVAYCCISILSFYWFAYQLSILIQIFKPDQQASKLSYFLSQNNLDSNLKQKIISYVVNQPKFCHKEFTHKLSNKLLKEYNIVQRQKLFKKQFKYINNETINQIIDNCIEILCQPNQYIFQEGKKDDCSLYIILEGSVNLKSRTNIILLTLSQFSVFGELSFYTEGLRDLTATSNGITRLIKIQRSTFLNLLSFNEKQYFFQQRDLMLLNEKQPSECNCCNSQKHSLTSCPYLTYKPDLSFIIKKFVFPHRQYRREYKRKINKDIRAFSFYKKANDYEIAFQNLIGEQLQNSQQSQTQIQIEENHIRDSCASCFSKISKERSFMKSTSFLKQQSGFDQQSVSNNDNYILNMDQNNEFQFIQDNSQQYHNQDISSQARTDQQKRTFNTAGFGSQSGLTSNKDTYKDLTQRSLNMIIEKEDSDSNQDKESSQKQFQTEMSMKNSMDDKFRRKNNDPKLTFNNNFESLMCDQNQTNFQRQGSGTYRQQSSRNSTYLHPEAISQRLNSSRSLTNSQYKQPSVYQQQYIKKSSFQIPQKLVQQSRLLDNKIQDENKNQNLIFPYRKSMTRIGSKYSNLASSFLPFSAQEIPVYANKAFGFDDFDTLYTFENYLTHNNYEITIYQANKKKNAQKILISKYLTDYNLVKLIQNYNKEGESYEKSSFFK